MSELQEVMRLATDTAFGKRMPDRSEELAHRVSRLTRRERRRAAAMFRRIQLPDRFARRAAQISHHNPQGAIRIVNSMCHIARRTTVLEALQRADYLQKQASRAARHMAGGNEELAALIFRHLRELLGDGEELALLIAEHRIYIGPPLPFKAEPARQASANFVQH